MGAVSSESRGTVCSPVEYLDADRGSQPAVGAGLCLSGGGYRAMLYHVGALLRLNELGLLSKFDRISSVSGGSITAGCLGMNWDKLFPAGTVVADSTRFGKLLVDPIRNLACRNIDVKAIAGGSLLPGAIGDYVASAYRKHLFHDATLQSLPDTPRFVINATNVQSGCLWRFSKPYMRDWRVGEVKNPTLDLATCVAASSAFPPFLSPMTIELNPSDFTPGTGTDLTANEYRTDVVLSDGGVYDNLGLETVWKRLRTVLVSDGGGRFDPEPHPNHDWARHAVRVANLVDHQVRCLRKRLLIDSYQDPHEPHTGCYWGIWTQIAAYKLSDALPCPEPVVESLANEPTRLRAVNEETQVRLIDWGYASCDASVRKYYCPAAATAPLRFPSGRSSL